MDDVRMTCFPRICRKDVSPLRTLKRQKHIHAPLIIFLPKKIGHASLAFFTS